MVKVTRRYNASSCETVPTSSNKSNKSSNTESECDHVAQQTTKTQPPPLVVVSKLSPPYLTKQENVSYTQDNSEKSMIEERRKDDMKLLEHLLNMHDFES